MSGLTLSTGLSAGVELTPSTGLSNGDGLSITDLQNTLYLYWADEPFEWGLGNYLEWG